MKVEDRLRAIAKSKGLTVKQLLDKLEAPNWREKVVLPAFSRLVNRNKR